MISLIFLGNLVLSLLSLGFVVQLASQGDVPRLHSIEIGFSTVPYAHVFVHPVWVAYVDLPEYEGMVIGNLVLVDSSASSLVRQHELVHAQQFRYLGLLTFLEEIRDSLNAEGRLDVLTWAEIFAVAPYLEPLEVHELIWQMRLRRMWLPPTGWPFLWNFLVFPQEM